MTESAVNRKGQFNPFSPTPCTLLPPPKKTHASPTFRGLLTWLTDVWKLVCYSTSSLKQNYGLVLLYLPPSEGASILIISLKTSFFACGKYAKSH